MALREDQIVRYGRQILLRELGGKGQSRLLASPIRIRGEGPGLDEAIAYLLAGGSPLELAPTAVPGGFLAGASPQALHPDASPSAPAQLELLTAGLEPTLPACVVLGAGVAFRRADACARCWALALALLPAGPQVSGAGSLAALAAQRLVLGWAEPFGVVRWTGARFETPSSPPCDAHRAPESPSKNS